MKVRSWFVRIAGLAARGPLTVAVTLGLAVSIVPAGTLAGVQRDVDKPQTAKPQTAECTPGTSPATTTCPGQTEPAGKQTEPTGKREEPTAKAAPSDRGGSATGEKVLQLPKQLWARAKALAKVAVKPLTPESGGNGASQALSGKTSPRQSPPRRGFACCNLHFDGDSINDGNYAELPMIAAGTPIEVLSYGRNKAYIKVDGKPMRLDHDYGRDRESLESWVDKIVVDADPRPRIASYPAAVREAIYQGKVTVGMTREQAVAAIGYPRTSETFPLDVPVWHVYRSRRGEYQLNFQSDGRLASVTGDNDVTAQMIYRPGRLAEAKR
jgi:hypothetical protein